MGEPSSRGAGAVLAALATAGIAALVTCGCATGRGEDPPEVVLGKLSFAGGQGSGRFDVFPEYRVASGDKLDVFFHIETREATSDFRLEVGNEIEVKFPTASQLNERQEIRPDGRISLPYLGEVPVVGKSVAELTADLRARYKGIVDDSGLYVVVREFDTPREELRLDLRTAGRGLSRLTTVRPDGYATFPIVGDLAVTGQTVAEVSRALNAAYAAKIKGLRVDVFLEERPGGVVYVAGHVRNPGAVPIRRPITVLEAMAMAGSHLPRAKLSSVIVLRNRGDEVVATRCNLDRPLGLRDGARLLCLQADDIVYVPRRWISSIAELSQEIGNAIFFRGVGVTIESRDVLGGGD